MEKVNSKKFRELEDFPPIMDAKDVGEFLRISRPKVYDIMEDNSFPLLRIGSKKKVRRHKFNEWLENTDDIA